ncbi:alpha/beta hydrolase [Sphingobium sp. AN558]|uniref:alpha/beta hydrolase n=1 Tax=Sphingobium sp. AN558 TaxID=3133442 RepID=UPI0030BEAFAB
MENSPYPALFALAQRATAPQHGPRPLPLFLSILWRETEGDLDLRRDALKGLRKYQDAHRPHPPEPVPHIATHGGAKLLQYGPDNGRIPVVFVPSLINPPQVLDLSKDRSMLRHMAAAGHQPYLIDWGVPTAADASLGLAAHITDRLLPLLAALPQKPILVGYCLGGTLALGAATLGATAGVATLAAPWQFDAFSDHDRGQIASGWASAKPLCEILGYVPMEVLQAGFWALDPARTVRKYARFLDAPSGSEAERAFLALEDWANAGPPLSFAAGRDLFEQFYNANASGAGSWRVGSALVDPATLACPTLSVRSMTDRIVPAAAAPKLQQTMDLQLGHVGMVVGSNAPTALWRPLSEWLCSHGG